MVTISPECRSNRTRVLICGHLSVETPSHVLLERDFPARQGRRLWSYLVLERRRSCSRDELAGALWDDESPDEWETTMSAVVSRLRSMLKPVRPAIDLQSDIGGYQLLCPPDVFVDFERARFGLHQAESALARGAFDEALAEARVALEIAARGFLPGDRLPWIEHRRRQLREIQLHAAECLANGELARGQPLRAEREAEDLILLDPLDEIGYRVRMQAAAQLGNQAGVLRAMHDCRMALGGIGGMVPSIETERLFAALTTQRS
ncbi:MAG: BTAD domain-containing putative transcriptional regulator [Nocardioides sp.]